MNWNDYFLYNEGELVRKYKKNGTTKVGWVNNSGYIQFEFNSKNYMLHRVIYEMRFGKIPENMQIDHIDLNPLNNKLENLRLCNQYQNRQNSRLNKNNTTGFRGVVKTPNGNFQARFTENGKKLYLGLFNTAEEAFNCVEKRRKELYGEFAVLHK
jgi:hypothetical protein